MSITVAASVLALNDLIWLNDRISENDDTGPIFLECIKKHLIDGIPENKMVKAAKILNLSVEQLQAALTAIFKIYLSVSNMEEERGNATLAANLNSAGFIETAKLLIIEGVDIFRQSPNSKLLYKQAVQSATLGNYEKSEWRMDIQVSQRSLPIPTEDTPVTFQWRLKLNDADEEKVFTVTPAMLDRLGEQLDQIQAALMKVRK